MRQLTILNMNIRQDAEGRYCLNDCHRASGGDASKAPGQWMANKQTKALVEELDTVGISTVSETAGKSVVKTEGRNGGTYVAKELVYAYAMWISPAFHLTVIRAFDAMVTGEFPATSAPALSRDQKIAEAFMLLHEDHEAAKQELSTLRPQAEAFDRLSNQNGRHNLRSAAQQAGWPEKLFIARAVTERWLYIHNVTGKKLAYADKIKAGLLDVKNVQIQRSSGIAEHVGQPLFTQKGLTKFRELIGAYAPPRALEVA